MGECATLTFSLKFVLLCMAVRDHLFTSSWLTSIEQHFNSCARSGLGHDIIRFICGDCLGLYLCDRPRGWPANLVGSVWGSLGCTT